MRIEAGTLVHYSDEVFELDRDHEYRFKGYGKPRGFWVSVAGEDDWESWANREHYNLGELAVPHIVTLTDDARILRITSESELRKFDDQYSTGCGHERKIDWDRLYEMYDGIIIAPYQWSRGERIQFGTKLVHPDANHGTVTAYNIYGCRCMECTAVASEVRAS